MKGHNFVNLIIFIGMSILVSNPAVAQLVINEIMQNPSAVPDSAGEWFEIYNPIAGTVDIDGWTIQDNGYDIHVINNGGPLIIPAGGFLVLGRNGDPGANGGVTVDYVYSNVNLHNNNDELVLLDGALIEIDRVEYDDGATFPSPDGASMALKHPALDNNIGANWCEASTPYGDGDLGTPGAANDCLLDDTTPPEITCPADLEVECGESTDPSATGSATTTDNIDPNPAITFSDTTTPGTCPDGSQITRTWTATDEAGNSSSCDQVITIVDTTPPVLSGVPEDITIECDTAVPEVAEVTASDNCDEEVTVQFNEERIDGDCPSNYVLERTWTTTDACNNEVSATQTITVQDITGPVIELIGDETITLECHIDTYEELGATVSDNCDTEPIDVVIGGDVVDTDTPGEYMVTYDAIDACGNAAEQVERIVNVVDTTPPVVTIGDMIEIWPPNHKYREFNLSDLVLSAEDGCEGTLDVDIAGTIIYMSSDEPEEAKSGGDGKTFNDMVILNTSSFKVRAERLRNGNGRVYTITFEVADASGNKTVVSCFVGVPLVLNLSPVDDFPAAGYTVTAIGNVDLDIKPGSCPNPLNTNTQGKGRLPMAILGTEDFDVNDIDLGSISIADVVFPQKPPSVEDVSTPVNEDECTCQEVDPDGYADLVIHFSRREVIVALGLEAMAPGTEVPITVTGELLNGTPFEATDCVILVGRED
ncbi:MAG: lamin tail domain-containing protein [Planctomycetota bacterium]|jgi:hypothetical protein